MDQAKPPGQSALERAVYHQRVGVLVCESMQERRKKQVVVEWTDNKVSIAPETHVCTHNHPEIHQYVYYSASLSSWALVGRIGAQRYHFRRSRGW